ncbi:MAG: S8 family serine peptidase [Candidatus Kuenenia sp.]|nr:S8 family serine peptidase [Candidatus Kuenenia hertensis]
MKKNILTIFLYAKRNGFWLIVFLVFAITVFQLCSTGKNSFGESTPEDPYRGPFEYVKGELIVKFNEHASQQAIDAVNEALGAKEIASFKEFGISHMKLPDGSDVNELAILYEENPNVKYAEPNFIYYEDYIPTDTNFSTLWALNNTGQGGGTPDADIDAVEAWDTFNGDPSPNPKIVVGVVDSGIEYTHEDLADNMWINPGEIAGNNTDDDNNGYIDDIHGINTTDDGRGEGNPMEDANDIQGGHGTAVAGVIGAVEGNGVGIVGVNFNVELMALKFIRRGEGQLATALECLNYVIDMKKNHNVNIRVLNNSWGGGPYSQALSDAIDELKANDILFIGGAGNLSRDTDVSAYYPASFPNDNVISVAGTDFNDSIVNYSSFGASSVDVFAPTENIRVTALNNSYTTAGGVSMSVAYTTGLASLLFGYYPTATYADIRDIIFSTVGRPVTIPSGKTITGGRINANNALNPDYPGSLPPVVTKIFPVFGSIGTTVTITGSHFGVTEGSVAFNGIPAIISSWSDTGIACTVPDGAATGKIEVTTNSSVSNPTNPIFTVSCMDSRGAMPTAVYRPAVAVHNGKIYAIGGFTLTLLSTGQVVNEDADFVQIYDTLTDTFSTTTDANGNDVGKPTSASNACAATIDGKIYVAGGYVPTTPPTRLDVLEVYDIASNTWDTTKAPLPKGLSGASAVALNGMLYVMGGASTGVSGDFVDEKELYRYDPVVDTWTQLSPMSTNRTFFGAAVINGKIYVCGGHGDAGFLNSTEVYDPSTDTWTPLAPMNFARYDFGCVAISGKLVAFGGNDSVESPPFFDSVEIYDPETDQWSIHDCPLSIARQGVRGAVVDNYVYALCGMNGPESLYNLIDVMNFDTLAAYYTFEEGAGTIAGDSSGNGNDGTINGDAIWTSGVNEIGGGLQFDGVDDYVDIGDIDLTDTFSIATWIKISSMGKLMIVGKTFQTYQFFVSPEGNLMFQRNSATPINYPAALVPDTWYHVAITFDTTNGMSLYLNGSLVSTNGDVSITNENNAVTKIGATGFTPMHFFSGVIDEVRIYRSALTSQEILDLYSTNSNSLLGYYNFEEGAGTIAGDSSGNGNDGTINGVAIWTSGVNEIGGGLQFDGVDDYVDIGDIDLTDAFSIAAWIKISSMGKLMIVGKTFQTYQFFVSPEGNLMFQRNSATPINYPAALVPDTWYHVAITFDTTNGMSLYLNGSLVSTNGDVSITNENNAVTKIGATGFTPMHFFSGVIDEVRIYRSALTSQEILDLYSTNSNSLLGYYNFEEGAGTIAGDSSGNGNDGTINGVAIWTSGVNEIGGGLQFDGVDDYVDIGDIDLTDAFSIAAWIKISSMGKLMIVGKTFQTYQFFVSPEGNLMFQRNSATPINYPAALVPDTWYHVAITFDTTNGMSLYLNGNMVSTNGDVSITNENNAATKIGATGFTPMHFFSGVIDEVRIYNRALSSQEMQNLYND